MLKKIFAPVMILMMLLFFAVGASNNSDAGNDRQEAQPSLPIASGQQTQPIKQRKNILIAYFSHSGSTREIANQIHEKVGGDIVEIQTVVPYPKNYLELVVQAREERQSSFKPALKTKIDNIESYDVIFLGFPIWGNTVPSPISTFLSEYDLSGKTIVPFCTHGGWGQGQSVAAIAERSPRSIILDSIAIESKDIKTSQNEIFQWLRKIKMIE